jgi:electron transport complex protein RnfG
MKETVRYFLISAIILIVAGSFLAGINSLTRNKIIARAHAEGELGLKDVLPQAVSFDPVKFQEKIFYYKAMDSNGKFIGAVFKCSAKGYSSQIETLVGMLKDGTISAIKILNQNETPGVGARVMEPDFTGRFSNKKDLNQVEAISGATISSKAVIDSVQKRAEEIKALIK